MGPLGRRPVGDLSGVGGAAVAAVGTFALSPDVLSYVAKGERGVEGPAAGFGGVCRGKGSWFCAPAAAGDGELLPEGKLLAGEGRARAGFATPGGSRAALGTAFCRLSCGRGLEGGGKATLVVASCEVLTVSLLYGGAALVAGATLAGATVSGVTVVGAAVAGATDGGLLVVLDGAELPRPELARCSLCLAREKGVVGLLIFSFTRSNVSNCMKAMI